MFILGLLGGTFPRPKISDSPPKVVSDLVTASYTDWTFFTKSVLKFNLRTTNMQNFLPLITNSALIIVGMTFFVFIFLLFNSSWAGQLSIVDFSVVTPYIPDSPSKGEILE